MMSRQKFFCSRIQWLRKENHKSSRTHLVFLEKRLLFQNCCCDWSTTVRAVAHKYNPAVILKLRDLRCLQYMMSCCFAQPVHDRSSDTCLRKCFTVNVINFLFIKFT